MKMKNLTMELVETMANANRTDYSDTLKALTELANDYSKNASNRAIAKRLRKAVRESFDFE